MIEAGGNPWLILNLVTFATYLLTGEIAARNTSHSNSTELSENRNNPGKLNSIIKLKVLFHYYLLRFLLTRRFTVWKTC